ncbi:MAG TPA: sterol desaturase family protein [Vicinamibacteria bacterium]|nr:sterol desaturase family protein [Vicinamibacteria bacterium]
MPDDIQAMLGSIPWDRALPLLGRTAAIFAGLFVAVFIVERLSGADAGRYRRRDFIQDGVYFFFYQVPYTVLVLGPIHRALRPHIPPLLPEAHPFLASLLFFAITDFSFYWIHRLQHSNRLLWAFHSVHHAEAELTFLSSYRLHLFDQVLSAANILAVALLVGAPEQVWMPYFVLYTIFEGLQHAQLPWRFGPFYRLVVSPAFHAYHHSRERRHHDRNFSKILSLWDHLFGTIEHGPARPAAFGLPDVPARQSLYAQWSRPFLEIRTSMRARPATPPSLGGAS